MNINLLTYNQNSTSFGTNRCRLPKSKLTELAAQNKTNREIAQMFGISTCYVRQLRQKYNLPPERVPYSREEFTRLVNEGHTDRQISEITGLSYEYTGTLRRKLNLEAQSTAIPKSKIEVLINEGKTNKEITKILGISSVWLIELKHRYGLDNVNSEVNNETIKNLVLEGKTDSEISTIIGGGRLRRIGDIRRSLGSEYKIKRKTDANIIDMIKKFAEEGKSIKETASLVGKSDSWVSILYKRLNVDQIKSNNLKEKLQTLIAHGNSTKEIAEILKRPTHIIYYYRNKFKI